MKTLLVTSIFLFSSIGFASSLDCVVKSKHLSSSSKLILVKSFAGMDGKASIDSIYKAEHRADDVTHEAKIIVKKSGDFKATLESKGAGWAPTVRNSNLENLAMDIYQSENSRSVVVSDALGEVICK